ncbi:MAG TPA: tRNA lysidine(34) synthetase TilS [Rhabdochlamydiaceae bacterium]
MRIVKNFITRHLIPGRPLLLGYSGGPDSKALLHLLLHMRAEIPFELHLAHVDHGWREESRFEAELLRGEAQRLGLPFHLKTVQVDEGRKNNLEERGRELRLDFFCQLNERFGYQALLLAHQAEDRAEVVLKRICEGASAFKLSGMSEMSSQRGLNIWRPLISIQKKDLIEWLERRNISFFVDPTNLSGHFLRGRLRSDIFPFLSEKFGKEIVENFCQLGVFTEKLKTYFLKKIEPHLQKCVNGPFGSFLPAVDLEPLEWQFLIKEWLERENLAASREIIAAIADKVPTDCIAQFPLGGGVIHLDRGRLFLLKGERFSWQWKIKVSGLNAPLRSGEIEKWGLWEDFWAAGRATACVPAGCAWEFLHPIYASSGSFGGDWRQKRKEMRVPSFLCKNTPLICVSNEVLFDVLTGFYKINNNYKLFNVIDINFDLLNRQGTD